MYTYVYICINEQHSVIKIFLHFRKLRIFNILLLSPDSPDSSVRIVIIVRPKPRKNRFSFLGRGKKFISSPQTSNPELSQPPLQKGDFHW